MARKLRAQSAMEYLMTYGWAILIIAVVLGALFSLGVFSGSTLIGTSCIAAPGYSCSGEALTTGGVLTLALGQNSGISEYNALVTVAGQGSSLNSVGFPTQGVTQAGSAGSTSNGIPSLFSGSTNAVSLTLTTTQVPAGFALSSTFTGYVWLNYSTTSCSANPCTGAASTSIKVATINVKVT